MSDDDVWRQEREYRLRKNAESVGITLEILRERERRIESALAGVRAAIEALEDSPTPESAVGGAPAAEEPEP